MRVTSVVLLLASNVSALTISHSSSTSSNSSTATHSTVHSTITHDPAGPPRPSPFHPTPTVHSNSTATFNGSPGHYPTTTAASSTIECDPKVYFITVTKREIETETKTETTTIYPSTCPVPQKGDFVARYVHEKEPKPSHPEPVTTKSKVHHTTKTEKTHHATATPTNKSKTHLARAAYEHAKPPHPEPAPPKKTTHHSVTHPTSTKHSESEKSTETHKSTSTSTSSKHYGTATTTKHETSTKFVTSTETGKAKPGPTHSSKSD